MYLEGSISLPFLVKFHNKKQDYRIIFKYIWQSSDTCTNLDPEIISENQTGVPKCCFKLIISLVTKKNSRKGQKSELPGMPRLSCLYSEKCCIDGCLGWLLSTWQVIPQTKCKSSWSVENSLIICNHPYTILRGEKVLLAGTTSSNLLSYMQFRTSLPVWLLLKLLFFHLTWDPISRIELLLRNTCVFKHKWLLNQDHFFLPTWSNTVLRH